MKFAAGDRVAWEHVMGSIHGTGSIIRESALPAGTPVGVVVEARNEAGTLYAVDLGADAGVRELTHEELIRVEEGA